MSEAAKGADWPAYKVERWPIGQLKPNPRNARKHPKEQIDQIRTLMRAYGWTDPLLVREDGELIVGHGRLQAGKAEGFTEAPVIVAVGWTEEQCRAFALGHNKVALNSQWDDDILGVELAELRDLGVDLDLTAFDAAEIDKLVPASVDGAAESEGGAVDGEDEVPEPEAVPVTCRGDLWRLGPHRVLCGDSTVADCVERLLGNAKPNLMVTDPPYGVEYDPDWRNRAAEAGQSVGGGCAVGIVTNDDRADWRESWAHFQGEVAYVWHGALHADIVAESLEAAGFDKRSQIIWAKPRFVISRGHYHWQHEPCWYAVRKGGKGSWEGGRKQSTLWMIEHRKSDTGHGTQKPVECMRRPMLNNSQPGDAVYDPFLGSGTTLIAAETEKRVCYGMEIDPAYCDVIVKRWQDLTGEVARLDGGGTFAEVAAERLVPAETESAAA